MKVVVAIPMSVVSTVLLVMLVGLVVGGGERGGQIAFWVGVVAFFLVPVFWIRHSESARQVFRRSLLTAAVESFGLPLAGLVFTGSQIGQTSSGAEAVGAVLGGGIVSGLLGCVGFFLGAFCLVLYLALRAEPKQAQIQNP